MQPSGHTARKRIFESFGGSGAYEEEEIQKARQVWFNTDELKWLF